MLAFVKIFVALFPFVNLAFLKRFGEPTCPSGDGWAHASQTNRSTQILAAAFELYGNGKWPTGISPPESMNDYGYDLSWLFPFARETVTGLHCIEGCYPQSCVKIEGAGLYLADYQCFSNCDFELEYSLFTVYATHMACTLIFLLIPILLTRHEVMKEMKKAKEDSP